MKAGPDAGDAGERHSRPVLERLRRTANKQRADTLMRLEAACDACDREKAELTFANVGARAYKEFRKGPTAQSIKNDPGLKEYVLARRTERLLAAESDPGRSKRRPSSATANQIERIPDETLRARIRSVYGGQLDAKRRLSDIQQALLHIAPGIDIDTLVARHNANPAAPVSIQPDRQGPVHTPEDVEGLRRLLETLDDPGFLERFALVNDGKRIRRSRGVQDEFIPARMLAALRRLHKALADRPFPTTIDVESGETG